MKKILAGMMIVMLMGMTAVTGLGAEASLTLDVASAYVFRGATFNDGFVFQPGLEVSGLPVDLGVWANLDIDDYDGAVEDGQFSEIDLYGSYTLPIEGPEISIGYTEYTYPNGGEADREVTLGAGLDVPLAPSISVNYGLDGGIEKSLYIEFGLGHEIAVSDELSIDVSGALGYLSPDEGDDGFSHYMATLGVSYAMVYGSVSYVGQIDDDVLPDVEDGGPYDVELFGLLGVGLDF